MPTAFFNCNPLKPLSSSLALFMLSIFVVSLSVRFDKSIFVTVRRLANQRTFVGYELIFLCGGSNTSRNRHGLTLNLNKCYTVSCIFYRFPFFIIFGENRSVSIFRHASASDKTNTWLRRELSVRPRLRQFLRQQQERR